MSSPKYRHGDYTLILFRSVSSDFFRDVQQVGKELVVVVVVAVCFLVLVFTPSQRGRLYQGAVPATRR